MSAPTLHALEWFTRLFHRPPRPRYCQLFVELIAAMIHARNSDISDDQKLCLRILIETSQRILTVQEWHDVLNQANRLLKQHPSVVGHWLDCRDSVNNRIRRDRGEVV